MGRRSERQIYHKAGGGREEHYRGFVIFRDRHRGKVEYFIGTVPDAEDARYFITDPAIGHVIHFKRAERAREFIDAAISAGVDLNTLTSKKEGA